MTYKPPLLIKVRYWKVAACTCRWWYLLSGFSANRQCLARGRGKCEVHDCGLHFGPVIYQVRAFGGSVQQVPYSCHLQHIQAGSGEADRERGEKKQDFHMLYLLRLRCNICKWKISLGGILGSCFLKKGSFYWWLTNISSYQMILNTLSTLDLPHFTRVKRSPIEYFRSHLKPSPLC